MEREEFTPAQLETELAATPPAGMSTATVVVPATQSVEVVAADYVQCDFCKCKLTTKGHVYEISDTARDFRDGKENHRKEIAKLQEQISTLNGEISKKDAQIRELTPNTPNRNKFL